MDSFRHNLDWVLPFRNDFLTVVFKTLTLFGEANLILMVLGICFWCGNRHLATRLAIIVLVTGLLNWFLKDLWQDPRPDVKYSLNLTAKPSFGAPSGHTQFAAVMWFWLAHEIGKRWAWITAGLLVMGVGLSRLYLGRHDVEDVLVGLALAAVTGLLYRWTLTPRFDRWRALPAVLQIGLTALGLALIYYFWPVAVIEETILALGGFLIGWLAGVAWLNRRHQEFHRISAGRTVGAALVGVTVLWAVMTGLRPLLVALQIPRTPALITGGLVVGAVVTGLVPRLLALAGLMRQTAAPPPQACKRHAQTR